MSKKLSANGTDPDEWAEDLAYTVYNYGDWFCIQISAIYIIVLLILFLKYRNRVKYDKVALTVLIL